MVSTGLVVALFLCAFGVNGQNNKPYFQQRVDHNIQVYLNDTSHTLHGFETVTYFNRSKQKLDFIYFHLWPNAYANNETAMAKQLIENGKTKFYYAPDSLRGYIDSLDFKVGKISLKWEYDAAHKDIAKVYLSEGLEPGQKIEITTPFKVKFPGDFSRMGHVGQSYQVTQWYPKPAVYDREGWHPMPYLDQGEFYNEYGSYEVIITLPKNYVVGATGDLQNPEEREWLLDKATKTFGV